MQPNRTEWQKRCTFNGFCKRVLKNEAINAIRESQTRRKYEVVISDLSPRCTLCRKKTSSHIAVLLLCNAMKIVMQHYASYIAYLSTRKVRDEYGNTYYGVDEDMRERLQAKLMRVVLGYPSD